MYRRSPPRAWRPPADTQGRPAGGRPAGRAPREVGRGGDSRNGRGKGGRSLINARSSSRGRAASAAAEAAVGAAAAIGVGVGLGVVTAPPARPPLPSHPPSPRQVTARPPVAVKGGRAAATAAERGRGARISGRGPPSRAPASVRLPPFGSVPAAAGLGVPPPRRPPPPPARGGSPAPSATGSIPQQAAGTAAPLPRRRRPRYRRHRGYRHLRHGGGCRAALTRVAGGRLPPTPGGGATAHAVGPRAAAWWGWRAWAAHPDFNPFPLWVHLLGPKRYLWVHAAPPS